jgi:Ni,Fe-hydrogenase I large subunit
MNTKTTKVTKAQILAAIATIIPEDLSIQVNDEETVVSSEDIMNYINTTLKQIASKNENARARAAEKKAKGDSLKDAIAAVLTDEFQTITEIAEKLKEEDATSAKIMARLTQLCKAGLAHKESIKRDGRKLMGYAAGAFTE